MTIISFEFLCFFAVSLFIYYAIPKKCQWGGALLISFTFYFLAGEPYTIIYLMSTIISIYWATTLMEHLEEQIERGGAQTERIRKKKKAIFLVALFINIGLLATLKYTNFFLQNVNATFRLLGLGDNIARVQWTASLGISFYTLQMLGYLIDVYWGITPSQKNILKLSLFASYFPQISSGPIGRYVQLEKSLFGQHCFDYETVCFGLQRALWGYLKKLVIAERLGVLVSTVYSDPTLYTGSYVWIATFACVLQIYADFSGNMDIVLGISECFGIKLPDNFRVPFCSRTIQEFWQRWHITLGTWLKDYLMYPILKSDAWVKMAKYLKVHHSKKAGKMLPMFAGMFVLWVTMGVWHGNGWKYIAEGIWFWMVIVVGQLMQPLFDKIVKKAQINTTCFSWHLFQSIRTFLIYAVGVVFFRAGSLSNAFYMLKSALTVFNPEVLFSKSLLGLLGGGVNISIIFIGIILMTGLGTFQERGYSIRKWLSQQNIVFRWSVLLLAIFGVLIFGEYGSNYNAADFIYAGF